MNISEELHLICKSCGKRFPSPVQMPREAFDKPAAMPGTNSYACPHCGVPHHYAKADYFFA
ncbi:hypothetical protein [Streptacidiphilus sp. EB129]|jgi:hypothetical protein|uniref:hypothetical protein n=1 Tax=Streptacidiphilus sp. EB129 TaxID=3156262 RepID=UPI00351516F5